MTRIFKGIVAGAMLVGLMLAPLGVAQAEEVSGGENGASFEWTLPTVGTPTLTISLNGQNHTIGGDNALGGVLKVAARGGDWLVSYATADCPDAGEIGKAVSLQGKTPSASLSASFTPSGTGSAQSFEPTPVPGRTPTASFELCA
jgi:hypothetical protein